MATTHYDPFRGDAVESEMKRPTQQFAKSVKGNEEAAIPPGYKQTEMGVFPKHWQVVDVGDLNPFVTSGSRGWARFYAETGAPFIRISNLTRQSIDLALSNLKTVLLSPQGNAEASRTQLQDGDILISITADIGIVGIVDSCVSKPAYMNQHIALIRFDKTLVCARFVAYSLASERPQRLFVASMDIGAKAGMSLLTVRKIRLALPPFPEQRAIAEALSDVDKLLGALEKLIAKKRAIKQAAMQQLLTGKTRLPGFSGAWELGKLADFGVFRSGNGFPLAFQGNQSGDYPFFKVSDLNNKGNELLLKNANHWISEDVRRTLGATKVSAGSIVFAKIGAAIFLERKRLLSWESCLDNNMMAFSLTAPEACEQFFYYLFLRIELGKLVSTTALPSLSSREIGAISVPLPPADEQRAIAAVLSDMDAEIAALERRRDKTRAIKQGMMQQLLTGRIRLFSDREGNGHAP